MSNDDRITSESMLNLLIREKNRIDQQETMWKEGTKTSREQQKTQEKEIERLKNSTSNQSDDYKKKWEEAELRCRQWEKKFGELENQTIKPLEEKIDQLQRDYHQMKNIRDRIAEICSSRQLTDAHFEQLKSLVNGNHSQLKIETIANKNDFHQQTIKLREMIIKGNEDLLKKIDEIISKKRKRNQNEDQSSDEDHH